jgi:hypothetical protein
MTMHTGESEFVINMQRFSRVLKNVQCEDASVVLSFDDDPTFQEAVQEWDWVNNVTDHKFILVADWPSCLHNGQLLPYYINNTVVNAQADAIALYGKQSTWKEVAHTFDMEFGTAFQNALPPASDVSKRWGPTLSYSKGLSMDMATNLNGNIGQSSGTFGKNDYSISVDCTHCGSSGSLVLSGSISVDLTSVKSILLSMRPKDISGFLNINTKASGYTSLSISYAPTLATAPIPGLGWSIPDVFTIGLVWKLAGGAGISSFNGTIDIDYGITASLSNSAIAQVDLVNDANTQFSGWQPKATHDFNVDGSFAFKADVFLNQNFGLYATLFDSGFVAAFYFKSPDITLNVDFVHDNAGVCGSSHNNGVKYSLSDCASLGFKVGTTNGNVGVGDVLKKRSGTSPAVSREETMKMARRALESVDEMQAIEREKRTADDTDDGSGLTQRSPPHQLSKRIAWGISHTFWVSL